MKMMIKEVVSKANVHEMFGKICSGTTAVVDGLACAKALGFADPDAAIRQHCVNAVEGYAFVPESTDGTHLLYKHKRMRTYIITHDDLANLITASTSPSAKEFEEWMMGKVLCDGVNSLPAVQESLHRLEYTLNDSGGIDISVDQIISDLRATGDMLQETPLFTKHALMRGIGRNIQISDGQYEAIITYAGICELYDRYCLTQEQRDSVDEMLLCDFDGRYNDHRSYLIEEFDEASMRVADSRFQNN